MLDDFCTDMSTVSCLLYSQAVVNLYMSFVLESSSGREAGNNHNNNNILDGKKTRQKEKTVLTSRQSS